MSEKEVQSEETSRSVKKITEIHSQPIKSTLESQYFEQELSSFVNRINIYPRENLIRQAVPMSYPLKTEVGITSDVPVLEITEKQGLLDLQSFLLKAVASEVLDSELKKDAESMLANLAFIGQVELFSAAKGYSAYFKQFLEDDPANQICIVTGISDTSLTKSDVFIAETILSFFSEEELIALKGHLVTTPEQITATPNHLNHIGG